MIAVRKALLSIIALAIALLANKATPVFASDQNYKFLINEASFSFSKDIIDEREYLNLKIEEEIDIVGPINKDSFIDFKISKNAANDAEAKKLLENDILFMNKTLKILDNEGRPTTGSFSLDPKEARVNLSLKEDSLLPQPSKIFVEFQTHTVFLQQAGKVVNFFLPLAGNFWYFDRDARVRITVPKVVAGIESIFFIDPLADKITEGENSTIYEYSYGSLAKTSLWIQFGTNQDFFFRISLEIPSEKTDLIFPLSLVPKRLLTASFPYMQNQAVSFTHVSPKPQWFNLNENAVYGYYFLPFKKQQIEIEGIISISPLKIENKYIRENVAKATVDKLVPYQTEFKKFLVEDKLFTINDPQIKSVAESLKENETNVFELIKKDYKYVVQGVDYDYQRLSDLEKGGKFEIQPANKTIESGYGICGDFSVLLGTILRAQGIPTQIIIGVSTFPTDSIKDNLHAWVEALVPEVGWIPIDPTWGELGRDYIGSDLDHIILYKGGNLSDESFYYPFYVFSPGFDTENIGEIQEFYKILDKNYSFSLIPINYTIEKTIALDKKKIKLIDFDKNVLSDNIEDIMGSESPDKAFSYPGLVASISRTSPEYLNLLKKYQHQILLVAIILLGVITFLLILFVKPIFESIRKKIVERKNKHVNTLPSANAQK